jgi:Tat protein translocase TatB subunit
MFNIGPPELIVILLVALLIVGPKRLPEVGKSVGKALREIRRQTDEVRSSFEMNLDDDPDDHTEDEPIRDVTASAPLAAPGEDDDQGWDATKWGTDDEAEGEPEPESPDVTAAVHDPGSPGDPAAANDPEATIRPADAGASASTEDATPEPAAVAPAEPADAAGPVPAPAARGLRRRRGPKAEPAPDGGAGDAS